MIKQTKLLIVFIAVLVLCFALTACVKKYEVTFDTNEGTTVTVQTIKSGDKAQKPEDPTKTGYAFDNWYKDSSHCEVFDFDTEVIKSNTTVYAKWTPNKYTVTYDYQGATGSNTKASEKVLYSNNYQLTVPTLYNYKFVGWYSQADGQGDKYTDENGNSLANWNVLSDKTLYAHWEQVIFASEGLSFTLIDEDTAYMVSKGTSMPAEGNIDLVIPEAYQGLPVIKIADEAFYNCTQITSAFIPNTVTYIGMGAFAGCNNLTGIDFPEKVTIDMYAFQSCGLVSVTIPVDATLKGYTFYDCKALKTVTIPGNAVLGDSDFAQCYAVENINSDSIVSPEDDGLFTINALGEIVTENGVALIKKVDNSYILMQAAPKGLTAITIPNYITEIGANAFEKCTELVSITLLQSITKIGASAFVSCTALTTVNLSRGLISIGGSAFNKCSALISITIPESVTEIANSAFKDNSNLTIYVAAQSKPDGWGKTWNYSASSMFGTTHARPVVWGCVLDYDANEIAYVVSFTKSGSSITNTGAFAVKMPYREGYVFGGWYTDALFTGETYESLDSAPEGELYAKWIEA